MLVGNKRIGNNKKCRLFAGDFDCHADAAVQCEAYCPMKHIQASLEATGCRHRASACAVSPRLPPWSRISNKTKTLLKSENFIPKDGSSTQLIDATSFV